jgi:hypothetical protein
LGLAGAAASGRGGVWDQQMGGVGKAGEGVVIGVLDSGGCVDIFVFVSADHGNSGMQPRCGCQVKAQQEMVLYTHFKRVMLGVLNSGGLTCLNGERCWQKCGDKSAGFRWIVTVTGSTKSLVLCGV